MTMPCVGDIHHIGNWKDTHSIDELKKIAIDKGYSGFELARGYAFFKKFDFKLEKKHMITEDEDSCKFYILSSELEEKVKFKWMAFPTNVPLTYERAKQFALDNGGRLAT